MAIQVVVLTELGRIQQTQQSMVEAANCYRLWQIAVLCPVSTCRVCGNRQWGVTGVFYNITLNRVSYI